jgi:hypothetical protein
MAAKHAPYVNVIIVLNVKHEIRIAFQYEATQARNTKFMRIPR